MSYERDEVIKRRTERRKRIRRKRMLAGFTAFVIFSFIVLVILSFTVLFPVNNITVKNSSIYTAKQIIKASGLDSENNLLLVSEKELTEKIRLKLPFVVSIKIKRELPDTLVITVTEAEEYACIKSGDSYYTLSQKWYVLNSYNEKPQYIFEIVCTNPELKMGERVEFKKESEEKAVKQIAENLDNSGVKIDSIDVTDSLNLSAKVDGRFEVNFGNSANLDKKIAHLKGMLSRIEENRQGKINLSMWTSQKTEGTFVETDIN